MKTQSSIKDGFTLIELLVVVSIIALLSSIILTNLASSRAQAENAKIRVQAKQIANAINLARDPVTGAWPGYVSTMITNNYVCLKSYSASPGCYGGVSDGGTNNTATNDIILNKITAYMPNIPLVSSTLFPTGTIGYNSYIYMPYFKATSLDSTATNGAYLFWGQTVNPSGKWCDGVMVPNTDHNGSINYYCYQFLGSD